MNGIRLRRKKSEKKDAPATNPLFPSEHEEQREFVSWFRKTYPGVLIFAIPNGGWRTKSAAMKLKVEGVVAGVPDMFIPEHRLFIEMKRQKGGSVSAAQKEVMASLRECGYRCEVTKGADAAKKTIAHLLTSESSASL